MRTGHDLLQDPPAVDADFLRMVVSLLKVLMDTAMETAVQFATTCGRTTAVATDVRLALQYEAHEFFRRDFDAAFQANLQVERQHTYTEASDGESSGSEDTGDSKCDPECEDLEDPECDSEDPEDPECDPVVSLGYVQGDRSFHDQVMEYARTWDEWQPSDPVQALLKRSIDDRARSEN